MAVPRFVYLLPCLILGASVGTLAFVHARMSPANDSGIDFADTHHYVTSQMEVEAAAMKNRRVPDVIAPTNRGTEFHIGPSNADRPQFVLFIKQGCPCSVDGQPFFNRLARKFQGKIDFVGVIDAGSSAAKSYATQFLCAFPVVPDQSLSIIHGFKAAGALFSALVARNGHIVKMWPGYNVDMLADMNRLLSAEAGVKETFFDPEYAPKRKTAGCAFTL